MSNNIFFFVVYLFGLFIAGAAIGKMEQFGTVYGFFVIGVGLINVAAVGAILSYLGGRKG